MKKILSRRNVFVFLIVIVFVSLLPFLIRQSPERAVFLSLTLFLWLSIFLYTKDLVLSSILYILIVLPFNVTMQLPSAVEIFNTNIVFPSPFVNGIYVNYLVPTVSILDLGVVLILLSLLVKEGFSFYWKIFKSLKNGVLIFFIYLGIQVFLLEDLLVVFSSLRVFLYLLTIVSLVLYHKGRDIRRLFFPASFIFLLNVLIQGVVGVFQVVKGASLGLLFLGESQVVAGMYGSSFIELSGRVFLRAYGTFPHPNVFAGFLILGILLGILSSKKYPGIGIPLTILSLCLLPITFSRVAILVAVIILLLLFLKSVSKTKVKEFSVLPLLFLERFTNLFGGDSSWSERVDLFKASIKVIRENFFLGSGLGNFVRKMGGVVPRDKRLIPILEPVHNIFVLMFSELGVFGFVIFFYVLIRLFLDNFKKFTYFKIGVLLSIVIIGSWDHYLFSLPQGLVIFMFLYLLLVLDLRKLEGYEGEGKRV
jgi:putative inorganic carbon (hco3(-)) transporter